MNRDFIYLLIGNSRLHWAESSKDKYKFTHTSLSHWYEKDLKNKNLVWASVGTHPNIKLNQKREIRTKDIKCIKIPTHFGVDRTLSCFCALKTITNPNQKNFLIADFGTTLSITKMDYKGLVLGGELIPGFTTQLKSMVENTKLLNYPATIRIPNNNFLKDTKQAMIKGVYNSLSGVVNLLFNPIDDILILCGGDSEFIGQLMKEKENSIIIKPNLAIEGLILFSKNHLNIH